MNGIELLENEEFKQIIGYPNYYISNQGRCYNNKTKKLIGAKDKKTGYVLVTLHNQEGKQQNFTIHSLVLKAFGPPAPEGLIEIDHRNQIRHDNRIENLRWCTRSENQKNHTGNVHKYVFLDELPETVESLDSYNGHDLDGVYVDYENEKCYLFNGVRYRELVPCRNKGNICYHVQDIEKKVVHLYHKVLFA